MALWVKRARIEATKKAQWTETVNRVFPLPFEERRARVGMLSYRNWRFTRLIPYIAGPTIMSGLFLEGRDIPHENCLTSMHIWFADHGFFRHDTIKALNPAYEHERMAFESKTNDRRFRFTGGDTLSERELREFAAINIDKSRMKDENAFGL